MALDEKASKRRSMSHTIRRSLRAEWPTPVHQPSPASSSSSSIMDRRQSKSQGETVRSLVTLLRPTPGDLGRSGTPSSTASSAEKGKQHSYWRHRPSSHHARKVLEKISTVYHRPAKEPSQHHHHRHLSHLFHTNEYPQSDDPSTGQSALERKKKIETVYGQGLELARQLDTFALNRMEVAEYLSRTRWDADAAIQRIQILYLTRVGVLYDIDPRIQICGAVNSGGTTCYIDSLLMALFGAQSSCDGLLYMRGDLGSEAANQLQAVCRLVVNYLRAGELVDASLIEEVRTVLHSCGWLGDDNGCPPANRYTQQDVSELYMFLMEKLQMPYLPLEVRMVHGADYDEADSRMVTQRVLELSLPDDDSDSLEQPLLLQSLLERYFFDNRVEQLERSLKADGRDTKRSKVPDRVRTNAWSILSMYPFYTPQSELGDSNATYPVDAPLVVPLLVKRYRVDNQGVVHRIRRRVIAPVVLDMTNIISQGTDRDTSTELGDRKGRPTAALEGGDIFIKSPAPAHRARSRRKSSQSEVSPPPYSSNEQYRLVLRSAICHKGQDANSGHYISLSTRLRAVSQPKAAQSTKSIVPVVPSLTKTLTIPAGGPQIQSTASEPNRRRCSCPDLRSSLLDKAQAGGDVSIRRTVDTNASSSKCTAYSVENQQEPPPPPYAHASWDSVATGEPTPTVSDFVRFDDLDIAHGRVQQFSTDDGRRQCLEEISRDGYLLFYVLQRATGVSSLV
ncbi:hypothetical protein GGI19_003490 [Coemansia pectinata]|uniref:ubiquitinyl hydrolase 1 n=1 Tax=Coemansia pectinata TaxID=1052879 RepID=A0A9W8GVG9_9FUNG|nr:hypothetical protein GGI19_003490 [Coemansia pectinata]